MPPLTLDLIDTGQGNVYDTHSYRALIGSNDVSTDCGHSAAPRCGRPSSTPSTARYNSSDIMSQGEFGGIEHDPGSNHTWPIPRNGSGAAIPMTAYPYAPDLPTWNNETLALIRQLGEQATANCSAGIYTASLSSPPPHLIANASATATSRRGRRAERPENCTPVPFLVRPRAYVGQSTTAPSSGPTSRGGRWPSRPCIRGSRLRGKWSISRVHRGSR